jgi:valyl-tRNA synthetase
VPARISGIADSSLASFEDQIRSLARLQEPTADFAETAGLVVGDIRVALDLSGAIDVAKERARLQKALDVARSEVALAEQKLGNPQFTGKAPQPVIEKMRSRLAAAQADVVRLRGQLDALPPR